MVDLAQTLVVLNPNSKVPQFCNSVCFVKFGFAVQGEDLARRPRGRTAHRSVQALSRRR